MKTIDIKTTQNVTITYELADARERAIAFILDIVFKGVASYLVFLLLILISSDFLTGFQEYFNYVFVLPLFTFYTLIFELIMNGQTPGKKIMRIKVIKLNGKQPGFYDYFIRWTMRILDIGLSFGILAVVLVVSGDLAQRLGDMSANTTVIKIDNKLNISLQDILRIDTRQNYVPTYPGIGNYPEEDILLIKQTIDRYTKYKNEAHKKAVLLLCDKLSSQLEVEDVGPDKIKFLKTLIRDYIVLTR